MIWILFQLLNRPQQNKFQRPYDHGYSWKCEFCHEELHGWARVMGAGANVHSAYHMAHGLSMSVLGRAECPACGALSSSAQAFDASEKLAGATLKKRLWRWPALAFGVVFLLLLYPALMELVYSATVLVGALAAAFAAAAVVVAALLDPKGGTPAMAQAPITSVHFYRPVKQDESYRTDATSVYAWQPAKIRLLPTRGSRAGSLVAVATLVLAAIVGIAAMAAYEDQFARVVFATKTLPVGTRLQFQQAGQPARDFSVERTSGEAFYRELRVRKARALEVRIFESGKPSGFDRTYHLPTSSNGWLIAPDVASAKTCVVQHTVGYGKDTINQVDDLEHQGDVYVFKQKPDYFFQEPRETETLNNGESSTRKRLIRALPCKDVQKDAQGDEE
jgi:hypothetical protein